MSKREKIMVAAALLAVLYGIYFYLQDAVPARRTENRPPARAVLKETTELQTEMYTDLAKIRMDEKVRQMIALLTAGTPDLEKGPFLPLRPPEPEPQPKTPEKKAEPEKPRPVLKELPVYSGYIEAGGKRIAIINGLEFEAGEYLTEAGEIRLRKITPDAVVVEYRNTLFPIPIRAPADLSGGFAIIEPAGPDRRKGGRGGQ